MGLVLGARDVKDMEGGLVGRDCEQSTGRRESEREYHRIVYATAQLF